MIFDWAIPLAAAAIGAIVCLLVARVALRRPDPALVRTNISGIAVPAVLGGPVVAGAAIGLAAVEIWSELSTTYSVVSVGYLFQPAVGTRRIDLLHEVAFALLLGGFFAAGRWDDRRGDERPRGFGGHWGALRGGALTGGLVKLVAGGFVAVIATALLMHGFVPLEKFVLIALAVALTANLVNLLDRAPGRALKVFLLLALPLVFGDPLWRTLAAGAVGAGIAALPLDLKARAMLGDAGANPLGAVLGLGLAVNLAGSTFSLVALVVVLLALNVVSERVSFSAVIARNRWLARLDDLGRD